MIEKKHSTRQEWTDPDDAPDLSTPEWRARFASVPVQRGRPRIESPKKLVSLRLDQDVIEGFKQSGPGWQTKINETLRKALAKGARNAKKKRAV